MIHSDPEIFTQSLAGAYILSLIEEASRDPIQNAGFSITWLNTDLVSSRMTSYSYRSNLMDISPKSTPSSATNVGNRLLRMMHARATSKPLVSGDRAELSDTSFAAFKALPVGSTHVRNESRYTEVTDNLTSATSCKEAVDLIVDTIKKACEDVGSASGDDFIYEEDIVRLVGRLCSYRTSNSMLGISASEAQCTTSIYAKMEYGVKRLLWLGR